MSWLRGRRGTVELRKSGVKQWDPNQAAFLAERAEVDQLARELVKESWPISRRGGQKQGSGIDVEQLAAAGDFVLDMSIGQPAEVAEVKRHCVCKQLTIERRDENSIGTPWFERRRLSNDRLRFLLPSLP